MFCSTVSTIAREFESIIGAIWGTMHDGSVKKLQVNMANIRKQLDCKP